MQKVCTISDLHLFCKRSQAGRYMEDIHRAAAGADVFVLNGDIFDFRWATFDTDEETVGEALRWLRDFLSKFPKCQFHYVLGNHDCLKIFTDALDEFAADIPNLDCHPHYLRLGNTLFLHGDAAVSDDGAEGFLRYRARWFHDEKKGAMANRFHDMAFRLGIHKAVYRTAFPTQRVVARLQRYLEDIKAEVGEGVEEVYFGHTHLAISGYEHRGIRFHNCGVPYSGLTFRILKTEVAI